MKIQVSIRRSAFALGILTAAAVFYLGAHVLELSPFAQRAWMDALWTAAGAFATWQSYLTLRHVSPRYRKGWVACTLAAAAWTLGMLSWSWQELVAGEISPFPSAADFGLGFVSENGAAATAAEPEEDDDVPPASPLRTTTLAELGGRAASTPAPRPRRAEEEDGVLGAVRFLPPAWEAYPRRLPPHLREEKESYIGRVFRRKVARL